MFFFVELCDGTEQLNWVLLGSEVNRELVRCNRHCIVYGGGEVDGATETCKRLLIFFESPAMSGHRKSLGLVHINNQNSSTHGLTRLGLVFFISPTFT